MGKTTLFWAKLRYFWQIMNIVNVNQSLNLAEIGPFFTQKTPIVHFLLLSVFFTVLLVVFGQPVSLLAFTSQRSDLDGQFQLSVSALSGLVVLVLSRCLLFRYGKRQEVNPMSILIWLLAELVVVVGIMTLVLWALAGGGHIQLAPLAGDLLMGVLIVEVLPYVISLLVFRLHAEHEEVLRLQSLVNELQPDVQTTPPVAIERTLNFYDRAGKLVFSALKDNILYIEGADNYVNIHYLNDSHEDMFILHNSLRDLELTLRDARLLRCHRCYIVNIDNVKLLRKDGLHLLLELNGGSKPIPVTKTYSASILASLETSQS